MIHFLFPVANAKSEYAALQFESAYLYRNSKQYRQANDAHNKSGFY
jgi:hypothetical protein